MEGTTHTTLRVAVSYAQRGWGVIPVYGVNERGHCQCNKGGACESAGKHPIRSGWTAGAALSVADLYAAWEMHPGANVGLRTGEVSGFFALDTERDGLDELAALEAIHGQLPATFAVRTGGGGLHHYFLMPDFPVRNNAKKLAPHIDIRGTGGQVVAAPSRSDKGLYEIVSNAPVAPAPAWLLDLLRVQKDAPDTTESTVIEDLPAYDSLTAVDRERAERYAATVLADECQRYIQAPPGSGNGQLFASACNVLEIVQSPWNTLTVADAWTALDEARGARRAIHQYGGGQDAEEFGKTFQSARGKVIGQGRQLPADPMAGLMFDPGPGYESSSNFHDAENPRATPTLLDRLRAELLTADQVAERPNPQPLVNGLLDLDSEAWLIGKPGTFKSFVALDLAGHVGTGKAWGGRRVHQGPVLYIVAEGVAGMTLRVRAWKERYGAMDGVYFLPRPVQVNGGRGAVSEGWRALAELASELQPALVIIDTQARVTLGLSENDASDAGVYIEAVRMMREATQACVLTIHHIGRNGTDARGSNAIDGAQGTELRLDRKDVKGKQVELIMDKQKDMADNGDPLLIDLAEYDGGIDPDTGRSLTSLVSVAGDEFAQPVRPAVDWTAEIEAETNEHARRVLQVIRDTFNELDDFTKSEVYAVCAKRYGNGVPGWSGNPRQTFTRAWGRLVARYVVEPTTGQRYRFLPVEDRPSGSEKPLES